MLALMDALIPEETEGRLGPLEFALCIFAAYTHDLGMALQVDEHRAITNPKGQTPERQASSDSATAMPRRSGRSSG